MTLPTTSLHVAILVFDEVEALDLAGPYEVFTTASRVAMRDTPANATPFNVSCVARSPAPVRARAGLTVVPDHDFFNAPAVDVLIVPGGVVQAAMEDHDTIHWIARTHRSTRVTASVCTGAFLLATSGVLNEGAATTHWEDQADLARQFPSLAVRSGVRWIEQQKGKLWTSGGISAGIDMSLALVARLTGEPLAMRTAKQMEFQWNRQP
ncbi:MAG: DJ-1/PfpI family protein [Burkholderiaceae bacterium]